MGDISYRTVLGRVEGLRRGITTGTCAAAAAKAAAAALTRWAGGETHGQTEKGQHQVIVTLPGGRRPYSGREISVPVEFVRIEEGAVSAGVRKDAGDDDDITNNALFVATASLSETPGVTITGGRGVGTVTREGLKVPIGEKAINPTPRNMIAGETETFLSRLPRGKGLNIVITVPEGEALAAKTWNPRLGITGGISIIGTSGVVEPKSSKAFQASIATVIRTAAKTPSRRRGAAIVITPGYVGEKYLFETAKIDEKRVVTVGDHVGFAVRLAVKQGFDRIVFAGHIGKVAKVAAGLFNTHSRYGDARLETVTACAAAAGADRKLVEKLLGLRLAEESVPLLLEAGLEVTFSILAARVCERLEHPAKQAVSGKDVLPGAVEQRRDPPAFACAVLDLKGNLLGACPEYVGEENGWNRFMS
jgi:cobalt-precorrin-5B (C1)-methyltransferase